MPEGLQVFNDSGFIQIDANYLNLELKQRGSFNLAGSNTANGGSTSSGLSVTVNGESPVIAIQSTTFCCAYPLSQNGNSFTFYIYNGDNQACSGEYFVFDNSSADQASDSGFQVFNPQGRLVFDAGKKYLRVLEYWQVDDNPGESISRDYPGKSVAVVMCDFGYRYVVAPSPADPTNPNYAFLQSWLNCSKTQGSKLLIGDRATYTNAFAQKDPGMVTTSEYPSRWLVVDVTNY